MPLLLLNVVARTSTLVIEPGFTDAPSLDGLGYADPTGQEFTPAFVDGATSNSPLAILLGLAPDQPTVTVHIYGPAGINELNQVENATNISWRDELNGPGFGSFEIALDDPDVADCISGRMVRLEIDGVPAFTFRIEGRPQMIQVDEGEESSYRVIVQGRGWAAILDDATVYPSRDVEGETPDLEDPFKQRDRVFSFASVDFPNGTLWPQALEVYEYSQLQAYRFQRVEVSEGSFENRPSPVDMPFPNSEVYEALTGSELAYWIVPPVASSSIGFFFYAGILTWTTEEPITFSMTADNLFRFYINGVQILDEESDVFMWEGWKEVTYPMRPGQYRLACVVENIEGASAVGETDYGGWLMGSYVRGADGNPKAGAITTNALYRALYSPDIWPGWTPGQIVERLIVEATGRGSLLNGSIGYNFSAASDSSGNPWTALHGGLVTSYIPEFLVPVGSTMLSALDQLVEEGWVDWNMLPGGATLQMWSAEAGAGTSAAAFTIGTNIVLLDRQTSRPVINSLLVSWQGGYVVVEDAADVAINGRLEDVYETNATSAEEASRRGEVELGRRTAASASESVRVVIEPTSTGELPYFGFFVNDFITVPDEDGNPTQLRVIAISCTVDDDGPVFTLELNSQWPIQEREQVTLLRSIGGKSRRSTGVVAS